MAMAVLISDSTVFTRRSPSSNNTSVSPLTQSIPVVETNDNHEQSTTQMAVFVRAERSSQSYRHVEPEGALASRRTDRTERSWGVSGGNSSPPLSVQEKRFWIKVIGVALCVNTLLVVAIVVGGVCATGGCSPESSSLPEATSPSLAPTASPSRLLQSSDAPSSSPAGFNHEFVQGVNGTMPMLNVTGPGENATDTYPAFNNTGLELAPESPYPPPPPLFPPASAPPQENRASAPPFASPTVIGTTTVPPLVSNHDSNHNRPTSSRGISAGALVAIAMAMEAIMVIGLIAFYRRWKSRRLADLQRLHYADVDTSGLSA
jgi:hypothetical protein